VGVSFYDAAKLKVRCFGYLDKKKKIPYILINCCLVVVLLVFANEKFLFCKLRTFYWSVFSQ